MLAVNIQKSYGSFQLSVAFEAENETLALLGASGSGKSVTLKCIAGIDKPDAGRIVLDGRVLFDSQKRINLPPQQRRVGYLFQQYALFPNMTVEQNLSAGLRERDRQGRRTRVGDAVRRFRLEGLETLYPRQLSGGQQQRAALARILLSEPETILLDEPYAALDGHLKWQLEQELASFLSGFSGTTVFVTHDADEVFRSCQRVLLLDAGASSPVMPVQELFARPRTVSAAMLAGCHTFAPVEPDEPGFCRVPAWGVTLRADPALAGARTLAVFDDKLRIAEPADGNRIFCRVLHAAKERQGSVLTLLPVGAADDAPRLRMALPREVWYTDHDAGTVCVTVSPADILLLP